MQWGTDDEHLHTVKKLSIIFSVLERELKQDRFLLHSKRVERAQGERFAKQEFVCV